MRLFFFIDYFQKSDFLLFLRFINSVYRLVIGKALGIFNLDKIDQLGLVPPFDQLESFFQNVKLNFRFET